MEAENIKRQNEINDEIARLDDARRDMNDRHSIEYASAKDAYIAEATAKADALELQRADAERAFTDSKG